MTTSHINKAYENELNNLKDRILVVAERVLKMLENSVKALEKNDVELAKITIEFDNSVDQEEMVIDRQCIELLATRQPLGQDLRFIVSVLKMVTYFERLGDLAVKICHRLVMFNKSGYQHDKEDLVRMAYNVQVMLKETKEAFLLRDINKAMAVIKQDDAIDDMYHSITKRYIQKMSQDLHEVQDYYHLLSIAKWLERMGDHCTNLAELIIFMVKGDDVRHKQYEHVQ